MQRVFLPWLFWWVQNGWSWAQESNGVPERYPQLTTGPVDKVSQPADGHRHVFGFLHPIFSKLVTSIRQGHPSDGCKSCSKQLGSFCSYLQVFTTFATKFPFLKHMKLTQRACVTLWQCSQTCKLTRHVKADTSLMTQTISSTASTQNDLVVGYDSWLGIVLTIPWPGSVWLLWKHLRGSLRVFHSLGTHPSTAQSHFCLPLPIALFHLSLTASGCSKPLHFWLDFFLTQYLSSFPQLPSWVDPVWYAAGTVNNTVFPHTSFEN